LIFDAPPSIFWKGDFFALFWNNARPPIGISLQLSVAKIK